MTWVSMCNPNNRFSSGSCTQACRAWQYLARNGSCVDACQPSQIVNNDKTRFIFCDDGQMVSNAFSCVSGCTNGKIPNSDASGCVCPFNQIDTGSTCINCPSDKQPNINQTECVKLEYVRRLTMHAMSFNSNT